MHTYTCMYMYTCMKWFVVKEEGKGERDEGKERERETAVLLFFFLIFTPCLVRRTILPRGSYRFTTKKKLSTQLTIPSAQPQFELSLSKQ